MTPNLTEVANQVELYVIVSYLLAFVIILLGLLFMFKPTSRVIKDVLEIHNPYKGIVVEGGAGAGRMVYTARCSCSKIISDISFNNLETQTHITARCSCTKEYDFYVKYKCFSKDDALRYLNIYIETNKDNI